MWGCISPSIVRTKDKALYSSHLWNGEDFYHYRLSSPTQSDTKYFPLGMAFITQDKEKNSKKHRTAETVKGHPAGPLMGYFEYDGQRVDRIIRQGQSVSLRDQMEKINGFDCYVIEAKTKRGQYTLWIDPGHGYNLAQAENIKQAGDLTFSHDFLLKGKAMISYYIKNVRVVKKDGLWMPMGADYENSRIVKDGRFFTAARIHVRITEWLLNPDHETLKSFEPDDIKDGAVVSLDGDSDYCWQDGKAVYKKDSLKKS